MAKYTLRQWLFKPLTKIVGLKILAQEDVLAEKDKYQVWEFGFPETVIADEIRESTDEIPQLIHSHTGVINFGKPFVFTVTNAQLVGPAVVGFDEPGNLIAETFPGIGNIKKYLPTRTLLFKSLPRIKVPQLETAYSLVNWRSQNYYHWVTDCLIRLKGLEHYREQTGNKPLLIIQANPLKWQVESLRLLGYEPENCIQWKVPRVEVKHLVVASAQRERRTPSPAACVWLREQMLSHLPAIDSEQNFASRIYISRANAVGRKVANEDEVLAALTPYGFKAYILENLSFADQVRLFSQAEIVVATHGAGLTNMIFGKNLTVIELFDSFLTPDYFLLAKALGFNYKFLTSGKKTQFQYSKKFNAVSVDIAKLQALLTKLLDTSDFWNVTQDRQPVNTIS
ncbi:glycosyltransferase family 61 protein [Chroogloeocystis siderophila]|uniref:glycosyltransferase family 61 protein n=1 Tax=Chroogloeocystis siderophila TaxID=329163 RepID=UPI0030DB9BC5